MFEFLKKKPTPGDQRVHHQAKATGMDMARESVREIREIKPQQATQATPILTPITTTPGTSFFNRIIDYCLYAAVLLTPLLFISITSEVREFNKQALLFLVMVIMLGVWVIKILTTRRVSWVKTSLDYILLAYLAIYFITSFVSVDKASSFLGYYGRFIGSFISVATFIVLYFLIVNNVRSEKTVKRLLDCLLVSSGLVLVYSLLQILGLFILPLALTHNRSFNPIGSLAGLAIFASLSLIFFQWLMLNNLKPSKIRKGILVLLSLVAFAVLFLLNAFVAWLVLALGMVVFLALTMTLGNQAQNSQAWFWKPMIILVLAILFVALQFLPQIINPSKLVNLKLPAEIQLSNSTIWTLAKNSLTSNVKQAILGSGPGTIGVIFGDFKPVELNKTIAWSLNFDRATSELANIAIETGLLGLLAFELTSILFLIYALFFILKKIQHNGWIYALGFFILWFTLYVTHFFYFFNTTFYFLFWLSIAMFMAIAHWNEGPEAQDRNLSLISSPRSTLSWTFASLLILAVLLLGLFFEVAVYGGEAYYNLGLKESAQTNPNYAKVSNDFSRAISLNPYRDVYYLGYGQSLIYQASQEFAKPQPNTNLIKSWMASLITAGQQAVQISPTKASNWLTLARFYSNIRPLVTGSDKFIIDALQKAIDRDPHNPALYYQLGQAYSTSAQVTDTSLFTGPDTDKDGLPDALEAKLGSDPNNPDTNKNGISDGDEVKSGLNPAGSGSLTSDQIAAITKIDPVVMKQAEDELNKAIELKSDLSEFYIQLARIYERDNKVDDAKKEIGIAVQLLPNNSDVLFEQGRITFNQKDYATAEKIFNRVLVLVPNHANALYSLGLIYAQRGDKEKALAEFEKVQQIIGLNNPQLQQQIDSLKK